MRTPQAIEIRSARPADSPAVLALLRDAELPTDGVPSDLANFLVAVRGEHVVGAIGLEHYGEAALLRSATVASSERGTGIGEALVNALLDQARSRKVRSLVLLTTTAEEWFPRFGFARTSRGAVPTSLHASAEFQGACPASAIVMQRELRR